ncbi:PAS domain S-box protein [Candidatus Aminicenantes bacterium AC-708-M15]|nr:PAS domain S-box protein [Candidatus Aminicenantes bacterium AC-708-M15]
MREFRASDINKTKSQLLKEIAKLRQRIIELEKAEIKRRKAEEALRESEEKYRATFESTGTATTIVEEDTTISLVNSEFEKLSGYSKEEIEGKKAGPNLL